MTTPEGRIKQAVKLRLKQLGAYQHWPVQNGMGDPCLDCHGCLDGAYFAIETKRPGGKPTARQRATIDRIRAAGGVALVVDTVEQARGLFDDCLKGDRAAPRPIQPET